MNAVPKQPVAATPKAPIAPAKGVMPAPNYPAKGKPAIKVPPVALKDSMARRLPK